MWLTLNSHLVWTHTDTQVYHGWTQSRHYVADIDPAGHAVTSLTRQIAPSDSGAGGKAKAASDITWRTVLVCWMPLANGWCWTIRSVSGGEMCARLHIEY